MSSLVSDHEWAVVRIALLVTNWNEAKIVVNETQVANEIRYYLWLRKVKHHLNLIRKHWLLE